MTKISFQLHKHDQVSQAVLFFYMYSNLCFLSVVQTLVYYKQLLTYIKSAVTRNYSEKSINNILDYASTADSMTFMEAFYEVTLESLTEMKNERLWVKTNLKLAKLWLDRKEYGRLSKVRRDK